MERIHVSVRARPISTEETKTTPWKISSDSIFMLSHYSPPYKFDRVFNQDCKTVEVYESRTKEIVAAAVRGFNGTVFAYGQTNSGKTHTMRGSLTEPGVIPLALNDLFDTIKQDTSREFSLRVSYLEIYNEDIKDLLAPPEHQKLQIHENVEKGIFVAGLREDIVTSPQQVLEMMESGESQRHFGVTNMNSYSSRSHTIIRMIIESRQKIQNEGFGNTVRVSVLNLVDLAGSERAVKTGASGVRLKEGSHINKSLMTLGTVIKKLSEGVENQGGHVPYRDSKLTRILQPALAGNANIAIICNVTLAPIHADETKNSLEFASRAMGVTNCARVNERLTDAALLKRQKKEIKELKSKLKASQHDHSEEEILNLHNTLLKSELEREHIALELKEEKKKAQAHREKLLQEQEMKLRSIKCDQDHFKKGNFNSLDNLATEVEVLVSEFKKSKASVETISSVMHECLQDFAFFSPLIHDFTLFMRQNFEQHASIISSYQNVQSRLKQKVLDLENEKLLLQGKCVGLQNQIEELNRVTKKHETFLLVQENLKNLEVLAFEMEKKIASLEELVAKHGEKEKALCRNEGLDSEITALTEKLEHSNTQIEHLQKDNTELKIRIRGLSSEQQRLETNVQQLLEEKEELALRLENSLLEMEEEKSIWRSKENALTEAMAEMIRLYNIQIESLSTEMSEAKKELKSCQDECVTLADRIRCSEENAKEENESSMEEYLRIDSLGDELEKNDGHVEKLKDDEAKEQRNAAPKQTTRKASESEATDIIYVNDDDDDDTVVLEAVDEDQLLAPEIIYVDEDGDDDDDDDDEDDDDDDDDEVVEVVAVSSSPEKSVEVVAKWRPHIANR